MELKITQEYIIAARLADPTTRGQVDFDQAVDWSSVLKILIKNKVPLNSLKNDPLLKACPFILNDEFQEVEQAETLIGKGLRDAYGEVRRALLQNGIQNILFKSPGLPPSFPYTSDNLDMLVRPEHIATSRQVLNDLGYVELVNAVEPQKWLYRKFRGGESISAIHLHGVVGWGVPFLNNPALWEHARVSEDDSWVMVPSPEDAFLITIAHAFYENKSFKLWDIARIRYCLQQGNFDFSYIERRARERGWEDGLAFCLLLYSQIECLLYEETLIPNIILDWARSVVGKNTWLSRWLEKTLKRDEVNFPFQVSFFFVKVLYYGKILNDQQKNFTTRIYDIVSTLAWGIKHILHIRGQPGMIVSFSGIDGSGKSVHSQSLLRACETSDIKSNVYWSRFGSSAHKNNNHDDRTVESHNTDIATVLARRRQRLHTPLLRSGWMVVNLIGYIMGCTLLVRFRRWMGDVVICDRYIYDAIVEIRASLPINSRWPQRAEKLLALLCPRPDIAWLLDVPAQLSASRHDDEKGGAAAFEELSKHHTQFMSLVAPYGLIVIPTSCGLDETSSQVIFETLRKYYKNYSSWLNALLLSNPGQMNPAKGMK